jgi:hypothetical protein
MIMAVIFLLAGGQRAYAAIDIENYSLGKSIDFQGTTYLFQVTGHSEDNGKWLGAQIAWCTLTNDGSGSGYQIGDHGLENVGPWRAAASPHFGLVAFEGQIRLFIGTGQEIYELLFLPESKSFNVAGYMYGQKFADPSVAAAVVDGSIYTFSQQEGAHYWDVSLVADKWSPDRIATWKYTGSGAPPPISYTRTILDAKTVVDSKTGDSIALILLADHAQTGTLDAALFMGNQDSPYEMWEYTDNVNWGTLAGGTLGGVVPGSHQGADTIGNGPAYPAMLQVFVAIDNKNLQHLAFIHYGIWRKDTVEPAPKSPGGILGKLRVQLCLLHVRRNHRPAPEDSGV